MLEREHDSQCRMIEGGTHWLQDKNRIVLEMNGIHLNDYFLMDKVLLNNNNFITTKQASMSLLAFEHKNAKQILYKKQYQNEEVQMVQFRPVDYLDGITGQDGKFIKWSDIVDSAWDSPE